MNPAAGNSLLKTLEEPTGDALLILLTARGEGVLGTIRSRCQRLPFSRLPRETIKDVLRERLGLDETEGHILAALSEGSFKKALGKDRELYLERRREILKIGHRPFLRQRSPSFRTGPATGGGKGAPAGNSGNFPGFLS